MNNTPYPDTDNPLSEVPTGRAERENKTYIFSYVGPDKDSAIETGYLVVTPDFAAVCQDEGDIRLLSPISAIQSVKAMPAVAGNA